MSGIPIDLPATPPDHGGPDSRLALLMQQMAAGDRAAFGDVYDLLSGDVRRRAQATLTDARDVDAVVAATFLQVWWLAALHDGQADDTRRWISLVAVGRIAERHRTTAVSTLMPGASEYDETVGLIMAGLLRRRTPHRGPSDRGNAILTAPGHMPS